MRGIIQTARRGYNAEKCHPRLRTVDSTKNQLKEYTSGGGTFTIERVSPIGRQLGIDEIEHNLGYQPLFMGWVKSPVDGKWHEMPAAIDIAETADNTWFVIGRPNDNIIQIAWQQGDFAATHGEVEVEYKYIIFIDPFKDVWS